jgi:hypothetical protein
MTGKLQLGRSVQAGGSPPESSLPTPANAPRNAAPGEMADSIKKLIEFFQTLDRWDREAHGDESL